MASVQWENSKMALATLDKDNLCEILVLASELKPEKIFKLRILCKYFNHLILDVLPTLKQYFPLFFNHYEKDLYTWNHIKLSQVCKNEIKTTKPEHLTTVTFEQPYEFIECVGIYGVGIIQNTIFLFRNVPNFKNNTVQHEILTYAQFTIDSIFGFYTLDCANKFYPTGDFIAVVKHEPDTQQRTFTKYEFGKQPFTFILPDIIDREIRIDVDSSSNVILRATSSQLWNNSQFYLIDFANETATLTTLSFKTHQETTIDSLKIYYYISFRDVSFDIKTINDSFNRHYLYDSKLIVTDYCIISKKKLAYLLTE